MVTSKTVQLFLFAAFGLAATASCAGLAIALAKPDTGFSASVGLAASHEARALMLASTAGDNLASRGNARAQTIKSLTQAPANATAWLRLAYLDSLANGSLGMEGNRALAASYAVAPFGPDDTAWRLAFAFNNWTSLEPMNRLSALDELRVSGALAGLSDLESRISNPAGRIAFVLTRAEMRRARPNAGVQSSS